MSQKSVDPDSEGFSIGPLEAGDPEGISALITRMSDDSGSRLRDKSPAYYRWMYLENPAGHAVVYSARQDGRIVASFAIAPKLFVVDGRRVLVGKTMDMFTEPELQGRGLIKRCTTAAFEGALAAGMKGWYVTPSVNSYPIFTERWGYREPFELTFRVAVLDPEPVLRAFGVPRAPARWLGKPFRGLADILRRGGSRIPRHCSIETLDRFGEEVDGLWRRILPAHRVAIVRDAAYLNWRYTSNPGDYTALALRERGTLAGVVVLTTTRRRGVVVGEVVDFLCPVDDGRTLRLLIGAATQYFREHDAALVQAWSIVGTRLDKRLRRAGLPLRRGRVKFLLSPGADPTMSDPEAWLLTQGDGNDV